MEDSKKSNDDNIRITGDVATDLALLRLVSILAEIAESRQTLDDAKCENGSKRKLPEVREHYRHI